jgi:O-antigen ligase
VTAASATQGRALQIARTAAIGVVLGAELAPPLANLAAVVMPVAFFFIPDWRARARVITTSHLALGVAVFCIALLLAAVVGALNPQGAGSALAHLLGWRTLGLLLIAFAVFDTEAAKRRFAIAFIVLTAIAAAVSLIGTEWGAQIGALRPGFALGNAFNAPVRYGIVALLVATLCVALYAAFDPECSGSRIVRVFALFAIVSAILLLIRVRLATEIQDPNPGVVLRNTVTQAMAFGIAAFFAGLLIIHPRTLPLWQRLLLGAAALLLLGQLVFLQVGRSGQVMFAILVLVAALRALRGSQRVLAVAAVPALAAVAFVLSPLMQSRFETAWREVAHAASAADYTSMGIRVVMWQNSVELVRARPLLGYGLGGVEPAYAALVKDRESGWKATVTGDPHNQFLALWIEGGLVGLLAFLFFLSRVATQPAPEPWRSVALALLAAWCATSMVSSHFQTFNEGHLIVLFLGVFLAPVLAHGADRQVAASAPVTAAATSA